MGEQPPYLIERPADVRSRWEQCAVAGLRSAATPRWNLVRWKRVRDLIVGFHGDVRLGNATPDELIDQVCGDLDEVQRQLVVEMFANWMAMYPNSDDEDFDFDPPPISVYDHERRVELSIRPTIVITRNDETEHIRLRTGRRPSTSDEAAVMTDGAEAGSVFIDAMVAEGMAEEIVAPPDAETRIAELLEMSARDRRVPLTPGTWCAWCDSASRCGCYPIMGDGRAFGSTRSLVVTKTQLANVEQCHRRVAWRQLYQIPFDENDEDDRSSGRESGILFHETAAAAIGATDADGVVEAACVRVDPATASELRRLWQNHLFLVANEDIEVRRTEFPAGVTIVVDGPHVDHRGVERRQPVAVTMIGILDVTGRESDGTPMVIEHRTGRDGRHSHLEPELYAASVMAAMQGRGTAPNRVTVHLHHLRPEIPMCERRVFEIDDLVEARARLRLAAETIGGWHPIDALEPDFSVGPWCDSCRYERRCSGHRGSEEARYGFNEESR